MAEEKPIAENSNQEVILVAEDSAPNRNILVHLLKRLGYKVMAFEDGQKAWAGFQAGGDENIVAVISDIMMPHMSGIDLLRKIRAHEKLGSIPVVLITAVTEKEYIAEAKKLKVNGYILKPVTAERIRTKFKDLFPKKIFTAKSAG